MSNVRVRSTVFALVREAMPSLPQAASSGDGFKTIDVARWLRRRLRSQLEGLEEELGLEVIVDAVNDYMRKTINPETRVHAWFSLRRETGDVDDSGKPIHEQRYFQDWIVFRSKALTLEVIGDKRRTARAYQIEANRIAVVFNRINPTDQMELPFPDIADDDDDFGVPVDP